MHCACVSLVRQDRNRNCIIAQAHIFICFSEHHHIIVVANVKDAFKNNHSYLFSLFSVFNLSFFLIAFFLTIIVDLLSSHQVCNWTIFNLLYYFVHTSESILIDDNGTTWCLLFYMKYSLVCQMLFAGFKVLNIMNSWVEILTLSFAASLETG